MRCMAILCAVDFSAGSALALSCAREIADYYAQPLTVATVVDPLLAAAEHMQSGQNPLALVRQALEDFVQARVGGGAAAGQHLHVRIGDPAAEIIALAPTVHAQLIVSGTQGGEGVQKLIFGSVAERLLRSSPLPTLVVPPAFADSARHVMGTLREVLVPVDFHEHAIDDALVAARVARSSHATLRLLHVVPGADDRRWTVLVPMVSARLAEQLSGAREASTAQAHAAVQRLAETLDTLPAPQVLVREGSAPEQIARAAADDRTDLIVLGLRGASGLRTAQMGSVAYRVLCLSPVPVLALPHETRGTHVLGFLG